MQSFQLEAYSFDISKIMSSKLLDIVYGGVDLEENAGVSCPYFQSLHGVAQIHFTLLDGLNVLLDSGIFLARV